MSRSERAALGLAIVSLGLGIVFMLLPPQLERSEIVWEPTSGESSGTLMLTRGAPEQLTVRSTCDRVRAADPEQPLLAAGSIVLSVDDDEILLVAAEGSPAARVPLPGGECDVVGHYDLAASTVTLTVGDDVDTVRTSRPRVNTLLSPGDTPAVERVELLTQPIGITTSWLRWSLGLLTFVLATASATLLVRTRRRAGHPRLRLPRPDAVDAGVLVSLLVLAMLVPALVDDGWVLARSGMLLDRWWFGNVFATNDAWLPQGFLHELVLGWLQSLGAQFVHLRLFIATGLAVAWLVLRHCVLAPVVRLRATAWLPVAATFVAISGSWLITVRAEPVVALFGTLTLAAVVSMERRPRPSALVLGLVGAALTIGTHQSGWVALGPTLFLFHSAARAARADRQLVPGLVAAVMAGGALSLLAVFAAVDLRTALSGGSEFTASADYAAGLLSEPDRYLTIFGGDYNSARVFTVLLVAMLALAAASLLGTATSQQRRLCLVSFAWLAGLLLTSSKWPWHVGVYAVPAAVFAALISGSWQARGRPVGVARSILLPSVVLLIAMAATFAGRWGDLDLSTLTWLDLSENLAGESRRGWWYAVVLVAAVLGLVADRGRLRRVTAAVLGTAMLVPLTANIVWVVLDAREPGWSFAGTSARQLAGDDACGVLALAETVIGAQPLETTSAATGGSDGAGSERGAREDDRVGLAPDAYPRVSATSAGPLDGEVPTWGTWLQDDTDASADAHTGLMSTPDYVLSGDENITLWTAAGTSEGLTARAVFSDEAAEVDTAEIPVAGAQLWSLHRVKVPDQATRVRLEIDDASSGYGGWAAVSAPVIPETAPAPTVFAQATAYTTPFVATQYPCTSLPDLGAGYWRTIDYAVKTDFYFDQAALHDLTITQVLCIKGRDCTWRLDYTMADVTVRAVQ